MPKYVVYEVWTRSRVIDADSESDAYDKGEPAARAGMNLCNWHVVEIPRPQATGFTGGLNYRQLSTEAANDNGPIGPLSE